MEISSGVIAGIYSYIHTAVLQLLPSFGYATALSIFLALLIFAIIIAIIITAFALIFGWVERKAIARMQSRRGPTYVGKYGLLQNIADLIKLMAKENIIPDNADKPIFLSMLPLLTAIFILMLFLIPFTKTFIGLDTGIALLVVFTLLSFSPLILFLLGWSSGNKFGSISAQRSAVMLISFEIPLLLVVIAILMLSGSLSFSSIINAQMYTTWYILLMPIGFVIFFIILLAELERPPFDLKEADSELIAGWLTDVSAPYYGLSLLLDYTRMLVGILLITVLFLGGWAGPSILPPYAWIALKVTLLALFIIIIRAAFYRMRLDKVLKLGWTVLMPLALLNLLITFILLVR